MNKQANKSSSLSFFAVATVGMADHCVTSYVEAVRHALALANARPNVTVDVVDGRGIIVDAWRAVYDAQGGLVIKPQQGRIGLASNVDMGSLAAIAAIVGVRAA